MPIKSIKSKILFLLLSLSVLMVLTMALLMKFGVDKGFSKYREGLEQELNESMVRSLEAHYAEQLSWQEFLNDSKNWHKLIFKSATETIPNSKRQKPRKRPYKPFQKNKLERPRKQKKQKRKRSDRGLEARRNGKLAGAIPVYTLFNDEQNVVIGPSFWNDENDTKLPLKHDGQVVGYLAYATAHLPGRPQEKKFNESILKILWIIAGVMIIMALLITLPVAKYFTRPIRVLNQATRQAAAGDYSARTKIKRNDELGQLGKNFNLLTQTLESNAAIQKKMMADISHELRTPVAVLLAQIEALQDGIHEADEKNLNMLHDQTNALRHLINDLHQLSVTDLGSMQYQMQAVDLNQIIFAVVDGQQLLAERQQINLSLQLSDKPMLVLGDCNRLNQLFTNIINNAINYTDMPGQIVISSHLDIKAQQVEISIKDSAPGLLPHEMQQMFDRLYRQEGSRSKKLGGSGLGLAIAKNIVEAHYGQIMAEASDLGGVCLTVRIPKHV